MRIFATKFTDISRSYYPDSCTDRAVDLVVALREDTRSAFAFIPFPLFILSYPKYSIKPLNPQEYEPKKEAYGAGLLCSIPA